MLLQAFLICHSLHISFILEQDSFSLYLLEMKDLNERLTPADSLTS